MTENCQSAARLGNKPIKHLVLDEVDKYPPHASKRETAPICLAEKRVITYQYDHKIWKISTPTVEKGPIAQAMKTVAQVVFDFWVKCPKCAEYQPMIFDQIKWNKETGEDGKPVHPDPKRMKGLHLAWYECIHCGVHWDDGWRDKAVAAGEWRSRRTDEEPKPIELMHYLTTRRPSAVGFHIPSWISTFVSLDAVKSARSVRVGPRQPVNFS